MRSDFNSKIRIGITIDRLQDKGMPSQTIFPATFHSSQPSAAPDSVHFDQAKAWKQVVARDAAADGNFVYAVVTTGIACRPSCPSRRPARQNVRFFATIQEAIGHGFRACLRCNPAGAHADTERTAAMCAYLQEHVERAVSLRELSRLTGLSTYATQRLFERVTGMTPRRYQLGLRAAKVRRKLGRGSGSQGTATITEAVYEAGYSASSRFYEKSDEVLGMRPVRFRDGGRGESIEACVVACSFGQLLVARTERGFCQIALGDSADQLEADLRKRFHQAGSIAVHEPGESSLQNAVLQVLSLLTERPGALDLPLDLRATVFQERVWQALRGIPRGETRSYRQIAEAIGKPSASRAVARACASNHLALAIPCHRVVGSDGDLRGYRWGAERKRRILALEKAIRPTAIKGRGMQASAIPPPDA